MAWRFSRRLTQLALRVTFDFTVTIGQQITTLKNTIAFNVPKIPEVSISWYKNLCYPLCYPPEKQDLDLESMKDSIILECIIYKSQFTLNLMSSFLVTITVFQLNEQQERDFSSLSGSLGARLIASDCLRPFYQWKLWQRTWNEQILNCWRHGEHEMKQKWFGKIRIDFTLTGMSMWPSINWHISANA